MAEEEVGVPVELYIYDLTNGMARTFSPLLLGKQIEGVWHTSIVVYGKEYFYGGAGITNCDPGTTALGQPLRKERLGETFLPFQVFSDYIHGLATSTYAGPLYNLLDHNCNHFSNEVAQFLCGVEIPKHILDLPNELGPQLRQSLTALIDSLSNGGQSVISNGARQGRQDSPDFLQLNTQIEEARLQSLALEQKRSTLNEKIAKKERKKEKKKKKHTQVNGFTNSSSDFSITGMADSAVEEQPSQVINGDQTPEEPMPTPRIQDLDEEDRLEEEEKKKNREPPIVFKDLIDSEAFDKLVEVLGQGVMLSKEEQQSLDELHQYLVLHEASWALGDNFLVFVGRLLNDESVPAEVRVALMHCLATCALRDDVVLLLHQDRKDHILMNYAYGIDKLTVPEQTEVALFLCNLFENLSSSEWPLYISEWTLGTQSISNIRTSTKVAVHSLLSEDAKLKDVGSAIIHNLACKEVKSVVFDDIVMELAMAIFERLQNEKDEEQLFRCLKALAKFCQISTRELPQLIQMLGPPPSDFKGKSSRIDEQVDQILQKVR